MRPILPVALALCAITFATGFNSPAGAKPAKAKAAAAAPAASKAAASTDEPFLRVPTIADAPKDDFQRVAWCHGILSGDMQLAEAVDPLEPKDESIQMIGRAYLRAYEAALTLSGQGKSQAAHAAAEKARQRGYDSWSEARKADIHKAAWAYDNWQLPGDCEHAAVRLSGHPDLFAEMATEDEAKAITAALNSGGPHPYEDLPKPTLKANNVTADPNAPIANNTLSIRAKEAAKLPAADPSGSAASSDASSTSGVSSSSSTYSQGLGEKLGWAKKGG